MSTLANILPVTSPDSQQNGGAQGNLPTAGGVAGLFEKLMAQAQPATEGEGAGQGGKNQQSHATNHGVLTWPAVKSSKSSKESSQADTNSQQPAKPTPFNTHLNPEIPINQMLAGAVATVNPMVNPVSPGTGSTGSPAASQATTAATLPAIFASSVQSKQIPRAATKISASDLSVNQTTQATTQTAPLAQEKSQVTAKEAQTQAKSSAVSIPVDPTTIGSSKEKSASDSDDQTPPQSGSNSWTAAASQQADSAGTSIAKQDMSMKQAEKTNNIAGQTEKVLPGNAVSATRENSAVPVSPNSEQVTATAAAGSSASASADTSATTAVDSITAPAPIDPRSTTMDRTQDMVTVNAMRLSDSGNNSMQVVIKPDAGTQLSLELRQHGSSVEVQAALQQGNFSHLSQQWPDLQQRLSQRGIQLAPLTDDAASANSGGNEMFQQKQQQTTETAAEPTFIAMPVSLVAPLATQAPAQRGWETWA